jgi:hypothetical protein
MTGRKTRAERAAYPLARDSIRKRSLNQSVGVCGQCSSGAPTQ